MRELRTSHNLGDCNRLRYVPIIKNINLVTEYASKCHLDFGTDECVSDCLLVEGCNVSVIMSIHTCEIIFLPENHPSKTPLYQVNAIDETLRNLNKDDHCGESPWRDEATHHKIWGIYCHSTENNI